MEQSMACVICHMAFDLHDWLMIKSMWGNSIWISFLLLVESLSPLSYKCRPPPLVKILLSIIMNFCQDYSRDYFFRVTLLDLISGSPIASLLYNWPHLSRVHPITIIFTPTMNHLLLICFCTTSNWASIYINTWTWTLSHLS